MSEMFYRAKNFNQDLSEWNVAGVTQQIGPWALESGMKDHKVHWPPKFR